MNGCPNTQPDSCINNDIQNQIKYDFLTGGDGNFCICYPSDDNDDQYGYNCL